nr:MAG TPA: hypothetical protein [Caudoviricetes sp.]DAK99937.1 MAG TPA: hypothetical protein [Caudoviricetes sp.]DAV92000.1 MAG TPA: hypothetical protein [Caudoviricetes sp.]
MRATPKAKRPGRAWGCILCLHGPAFIRKE